MAPSRVTFTSRRQAVQDDPPRTLAPRSEPGFARRPLAMLLRRTWTHREREQTQTGQRASQQATRPNGRRPQPGTVVRSFVDNRRRV